MSEIERLLYNKKELRNIIRSKCVKKETVTLRSGRTSDFYIDCRPAILGNVGHQLIGEIVSMQCALLSTDASLLTCTGVGGSHMASAVASWSKFYSVIHVRDVKKEHGTKKTVEIPVPFNNGSPAIVIDDVLTTGSSLEHCITQLAQNKIACHGCVVLVDRCEGGREILEKGYKIPVVPIFRRSDFIR